MRHNPWHPITLNTSKPNISNRIPSNLVMHRDLAAPHAQVHEARADKHVRAVWVAVLVAEEWPERGRMKMSRRAAMQRRKNRAQD